MLSLTGAQPAPALAVDGGVHRHFPAAASGHRRDGRHAAGDGAVTAQMRRQGRSIAALYASNTFGAVIGVLATRVLAGARAGPGAHRWRLRRAQSALRAGALAAVSGDRAAATAGARMDRAGARVLFRLAVTGLLGIGYEVLVVRVLSQVTEDTVYTFALLLAVYLVGTAAGAAAYQRWLRRRRDRTPRRRSPAGGAGGGLPRRYGVTVGGRAREGAARADVRRQHRRGDRRRGGARSGRVRPAHGGHGRAVQPPRPPRRRRRGQLRPRAGGEHAGRGGGAGAVRRARVSGAGAQAGAAAGRRSGIWR